MDSLQTLVLLMSLAVIIVGIALKLRIPYPLGLVMGGAILGFTPGLSEIHYDPNFVLIIVLPPTLFYAAYSIPFKEFKKNIGTVLWMALGLVLVTTLAIGLLFKWLFPSLPWTLAFTFGAIISPPDAIAATAILKRFAISQRLLTVLEGESLINDATGLVLYKLGVIALLSGTFSLGDAGIEFVKIAGGGILVGVITGFVLHGFSSFFFNPVLAVIFSFLIPYLTYLIADSLEVSGVLAVVLNGLIGSRMLLTRFSSLTRVMGWASWDIVVILLNCFVFILIGLQLRGIIERLTLEKTLLYFGYGALITAATIFVRFLSVSTRRGIRYWLGKNSEQNLKQNLREIFILSWSGMRGIVSLTIVLALPLTLNDGSPLPGRDIVIFLTFVVIFLTLLIPGLTLAPLLHYLNIHTSSVGEDTKELRQDLIKIATEELKELRSEENLNDEEYEFLLNYIHMRHRILEIVSGPLGESHRVEIARHQVIRKKRERLLELWQKNEINDRLFDIIERELDLEDAHQARAEL